MLRVGPLKINDSFVEKFCIDGQTTILHCLPVRFVDVVECQKAVEQFETYQSLALAFFGVPCRAIGKIQSWHWQIGEQIDGDIVLQFGADPIQSRQGRLRRLSTLLGMRANQMRLAPSFQAELEQVLFH